MRFTKPSQRLLLFAGLFASGNILLAAILAIIANRLGYDVTEMSEILASDPNTIPVGVLKSLVWIQTVCLFILPSIIFGLICYRKTIGEYFSINRTPTLLLVFLSILLLITGYPLVSLSYEVNELIPWPEWTAQMDSSANSMLDSLLNMQSVWAFLSTVLIVAVLPAIGEELVFRGVLQKQIAQMTGNPVAGVWIAAIIFSAIHLQFEGFLPRVLLGAIMGYIYLWSKNLWVPIIVHLFNNGIQIAVLYFADIDMRDMELSGEASPGFLTTFVSILLFIATAVLIHKLTTNGDTGDS